MPTPEQQLNNIDLDRRIREADAEYEEYIRYFDEKRKQFYKENPNFNLKTMHIPILPKSFVGGIRYTE